MMLSCRISCRHLFFCSTWACRPNWRTESRRKLKFAKHVCRRICNYVTVQFDIKIDITGEHMPMALCTVKHSLDGAKWSFIYSRACEWLLSKQPARWLVNILHDSSQPFISVVRIPLNSCILQTDQSMAVLSSNWHKGPYLGSHLVQTFLVVV